MRRLLQADIRRIAQKAWPWVLLTVSYIIIAIAVTNGMGDCPDRAFHFLKLSSYSMIGPSLVMGFSMLLGVYGDEFHSMAMISVIGRGLSREKYVLAKFLDVLIFGFQLYALTAAYLFILSKVLALTFTSAESKYLVCMLLFDYLQTVTYVAIAAIFFFLSGNAPLGVFAYLAFQLIVPSAIFTAIQLSPAIAKYHLDSFYVNGIYSMAFADIIMGDIAGAVLKLFSAVLIYVGGSVAIAMLVFHRKELEF